LCFFDHTNKRGQNPTDRANQAGYTCRKSFGSYYTDGIGENIFQHNTYNSGTYGIIFLGYIPVPYGFFDYNDEEELSESIVDGWMDSPGHRENILTPNFDREGVGIVKTGDSKIYITQNFC